MLDCGSELRESDLGHPVQQVDGHLPLASLLLGCATLGDGSGFFTDSV